MMIKTVELTKIFRTEDIETIALDKVSIEIEKGEFVAIVGPSGCGKTSLLNILGLLDSPSSGQHIFLNQDVSSFNERQLAMLRKTNIGFVFQNFNLIDELSVFENIELPLLYLGMSSRERKNRVNELLERMNIGHRSRHFPNQLSGGQQQRVALARAIIAQPPLLLADEPTGNLDSAQGEEVMNLLDQLNREGTTILMVTHSPRDAQFSRRTIHLFDGQVISENIYRQLVI